MYIYIVSYILNKYIYVYILYITKSKMNRKGTQLGLVFFTRKGPMAYILTHALYPWLGYIFSPPQKRTLRFGGRGAFWR